MITLLPDQVELLDNARNKIRAGCKALLIQAATGSGKTYLSSDIVRGAYTKGSTAHFIVPRIQLIKQTSETFRRFGIPHSFIAAGHHNNPHNKINVCSKDTILSRLDKIKPPQVAIIDEAHYGGDGLDAIVQAYKKAGTVIVGLSATPWDLQGRGMRHQYDDMVCGPSIRWLIDNKRLAEYRLFAPDVPDLTGIREVAGDYAKGQLAERMEGDSILIGSSVKHYKEHAMGKLGVTFAVSRKHSEILAQAYRDAGIPAMHIDGETPNEVRERICRAFARRELLQLCNAELLTFGFDLSSASGMDARVEVVTDCQPTRSLAKQMQKWGRGLRYDDEPHMFFDHAGNAQRHGLPCQEREWTLDGRKKTRRGEQERTIPVKSCPKCYFCHPPAPKCPACGEVYPIQSRDIKEVEGELKEVEKKVEAKKKRMEVGQARTMDDLRKIAAERGYKSGWIWKQAQLKGIRE